MARTKAQPDETAAEMQELIEASAEKIRRYVGPDYDLGIQIYGRAGMVRPRDLDAAGIELLIQQHPKCAAWWLHETA